MTAAVATSKSRSALARGPSPEAPKLATMILSMAEIDSAVRASWAADTCSADDAVRAPWAADNPAWGHCDITALVLHDLLGGNLMVGEVHLDGEQHGYHWWNRLDSRAEIDLTRVQF